MKIALVACGSRGDVQPILALALGLRAAGHEVLLTVPPDFEALACEHGIEALALGPGFRNNPEMRDASPRSFARFIKREIREEIRELPALARGSDLLIATGLAFGGRSVAEHLGVPYRLVAFAPLAILGTDRDPLALRAGGWIARLVVNLGLRGALNRERSAIGLPPVRDVLTHWAGERVIAATDPALTRLPEGAVPKAVQTGYMHLRQQGALEEALERFLGAGPVPIYVGFGSMPIARPSELVSRVVSVARAQDRRFVVLARDLPPGALAEEPRCFVTGNVPHERLFARVAAVVHHGGAGTVAAAARAGVPQIVVPLMSDQPHWRSQVVALGLGPGGPGFKRLTAGNLGRAVAACLSDPAYARRAREVAAAIAGTDGVALTVALIERDHGRSQPAVPSRNEPADA